MRPLCLKTFRFWHCCPQPVSHPLDQPVGARYRSWSLHSYRYVYDVSSVTSISGACPPHRGLQVHMTDIHVSQWQRTLQCLSRNAIPTCLKNCLQIFHDKALAPLLDSNVCCYVFFPSGLHWSVPSYFPDFASTCCLPGRAFRHPLFADRPLCRNLASFALSNVLPRLARFVSCTFTMLLRFKSTWAVPSAACVCTAHPCRINSKID